MEEAIAIEEQRAEPVMKPKPNVVPGEAVAVARSFVFEHRDADGIDPREVVARMLAAGHGSDFPTTVRRKRLKTWALQVLRRLRKHGWLDAPGHEGWPPTAALKTCPDLRALARHAPRRTEPETPTPLPSPPESWESFIQEWVFRHRHSDFGVAQVAVAVVQRGYATGDIGDRLDQAREIVEQEFGSLKQDGLLRFSSRPELWKPTELLRTWPTVEGAMED